MIEKNGMLSDKSYCDFEPTKKAEYYDEQSERVASGAHKDKLIKPVKIQEEN
jgi:hypothetical protein